MYGYNVDHAWGLAPESLVDPPRVEVIWLDACLGTAPGTAPVASTGYLLKADDEVVMITMSLSWSGDSHVASHIGPTLTIPRSIVVEIAELGA